MGYGRTEIEYNGNKMTFFGLFETDHIFKHLNSVNNFYELKLLEKVRSLNMKGTYVDVGANIGNHTIYFSKFCKSDNVISIEMDNQIFDVLNQNVTNNKLDNVTTINMGVGEKHKTVTTSSIDKSNVGMTKILSEGGDVVVNTLDSILMEVNNINLIKIDVEGYESKVLMGAKNTILKHSPVIIAELRNEDEFKEFESIASEMGYTTDKVNYASTPTYFWYKKEREYEFIYIIPSFERYDKLKSLVDSILDVSHNTLIIVLNDGSTDERYSNLISYDNRVVYLKNTVNNGKERYWMTVNGLMDEMSKYNFKYGVMLGDDFQLVEEYYQKLKSYINESDIIRLFTQISIGETNWGYKNWIDGAFCAPYSFFKKINFELFPIQRRGRMESSGVGIQMSKRLNNLRYTVKNYGSLIHHIGNDDSKMHPSLRKSQPLITNFGDGNKILSIIIPTFKNTEFLIECIDSIIASIKDLNCEILIGIDGCEITKEFVKDKKFDERVNFFFFRNNVGPYIVKNSLSTITKSDYILFFDSDDIMTDNLIQDCVRFMKTHKLIKPMYLNFNDNSSNIDINITKTNTYGEGVFAIDKKTFLTMNGFEGWRCAADSDLMSRLYKNNVKLMTTKTIGFYRRVHKNSLTQHPETSLSSSIRAKYSSISRNKKYFGPLPKLSTDSFEGLYVDRIYNSEKERFIQLRNERERILNDVLKLNVNKKKTVNYDIINLINDNPKIYSPSKNIKPFRENTPNDRNKLFEIKKGTLAEQNKVFFPQKRERDDTRNPFSKKSKP